MRGVKIQSPWPLIALLAVTAVAPRTEPVEPILMPLAHSALITLEGATLTDGALLLRVRANPGAAAVTASDISVAIDGKDVPVTARADGSWRVSVPSHPGADDRTLDVTVTHDGIRELLRAKIAPPAAAAAQTPAAASGGGGASGVHRQIVWWILNIAIVLIAALALSRRRS
jgi:hypothetical protein